ncbi:DegQ family serine endoprotease [Aurantimonas sp. VKM B-3413]|uniref:DegQ family serine endoprotease n=1 Tax=Aurantimonas sp. VKM B-3413 TaxID=2779401 RepID=UPI001E3316E6|nr:DegQ family serine endoprotease [Aurantimonas sp. VKM B-3413]MCB8836863.1 Do family serine endopeptidase [Aurantimonas sp. VKM B-3413]
MRSIVLVLVALVGIGGAFAVANLTDSGSWSLRGDSQSSSATAAPDAGSTHARSGIAEPRADPAEQMQAQAGGGELSAAGPRPSVTQPVPAVPVPATAPAEQVPQSRAEINLTFAPLVRETAPAVVNVYAARAVPQQRSPFAGDPFFEQFFGQRYQSRPRMEASLGSGVIIDQSGLVITNNHVVENADEVKIAFSDGREFQTTVLLKDKDVDLAVLKIKGKGPFPTLPIADSDDLQIGDLVLAIGNPFGIGQTVTNGIVSALARSHIGVDDFGFFIQTDAAINPGNSGGALIDMSGRLVGVNSAIFSRSGGSNGIGFAIPSNMVKTFIAAAKAGHGFQRPYVGAQFASVTPDIAEAIGLSTPTGALIQAVTKKGPAANAGLKVGDVVLAVGGRTIDSPDALSYRLATTGIGKTVDLEILRGEDRLHVSLPLEAAPEIPPRDERTLSGNEPFSGATVLNLSPRVAESFGLSTDQTGVIVSAIAAGSIAQRVGLRPGDIVLAVNGQKVDSTSTLEELSRHDFSGWRFDIDRGGQRLTQYVR